MKDRGRMTTEFTVWCFCGGCWLQVCAHGKRDAAKEAKRSGWRYTSKDGWTCPGCIKGIPAELHRFHGCEGPS